MSKMPKIALNRLVRRQTKNSKFSYFSGSERDLIALVEQNFPLREEIKEEITNKKGVFSIPVSCIHNGQTLFFSGIVKARPEYLYRTEFVPRGSEKDARLSTTVYGAKTAGQYANIIIYSIELLKEIGKNTTQYADYEIVSINVSPDEPKIPPHPYDLLRSYRRNPQAFSNGVTISMVMRALDYWSTHAYVRSEKKLTLLDKIDDEIVHLVVSGETAKAMKLYRTQTGCDMGTASATIKKMQELLAEKNYPS